jgi:hypothetical protein
MKSRMSREVQVRFCERLEGSSPWLLDPDESAIIQIKLEEIGNIEANYEHPICE